MAAELRDIRSAAIDGRMHNPFFQKEQLKRLHDILSKNITEIQDQIARDHRYTQAEASVEYWLALRCIAEAYKSIDPKQHLQAEYAIAKSKDASDAREPVGIVVVEPAQHTFFYSLISALVPALVHGNCIIVQTEKTLLESPKFIMSLVGSALDDHVFKVVYSQLTDDEIASRHTRIVQKLDVNPRVIAIIERDADLQLAAKAVASARFSLRGKSPFAPDLVLVNEWVKKDFLSALAQHTSAFISDTIPKDPVQKLSKSRFHDTILKENLGEVVFSTSEGYMLNVKNRSEECYLAVHSVTSMDDAIDLSRRLV
ncbi:unnamed protein product [Clonostachys solani]|uniref:Aldehyde dehydrogenase domain-containing protein n=1 Tax=Clonostachys solani TaxID=160281 RepID=A0A9N9YXT2_9HYPO|nr:unnamed protein product [Clonostachys solani]